jgi:hypothetical protein
VITAAKQGPPPALDPLCAVAGESLSAVLLRLSLSESERLSIADLMEGLGERSFGSVLLVLALPATLLPPLASAVLGAPLLLISAQLLVRRARPWLPNGLSRLSLEQTRASRVLRQTARTVVRLETASRPRLDILLHPWHARLIAAGCMGLSIVLMLPTPIAHTAAGLGIGAFAAGLIQRDGLALLTGWLLTIACGLILVLMVGGALIGLHHLG